MFINASEFPSWYINMGEQTTGRGTQVYSYKCHIFINKIVTIVTTSVYVNKVH